MEPDCQQLSGTWTTQPFRKGDFIVLLEYLMLIWEMTVSLGGL